jgi:hypothetical protein
MYKVEIDFDQASLEWRKNKKYKGGGVFEYRCSHLTKNGTYCKNKIYSNYLCKYHIKLFVS